jgi:hypothetical protein
MTKHSLWTGIAAGVGLGWILTAGYAVSTHRALRTARMERMEMRAQMVRNYEKVREYACDGIDGMECYRVTQEYRARGLGAAIEMRAGIMRSLDP